MKVKSLLIEKKENYDNEYPGQLVGLVQIIGEHGKMEVKLSNSVVSQIFSLVKADAQRVADYNAGQVTLAVENAESAVSLIEHIE